MYLKIVKRRTTILFVSLVLGHWYKKRLFYGRKHQHSFTKLYLGYQRHFRASRGRKDFASPARAAKPREKRAVERFDERLLWL